MTLPERLYTLALRAAASVPLIARGESKVARSIRGREGVIDRFREWAEREREPGRPLVWFHAPSVGEGLQARAVIEVFRERVPEAQVVYTFFSASAESFARTVPADHVDYLPFDLPEQVTGALDALRPDVMVFSKTDVWPNLTRLAAARGVKLALLSATLPAGSSRLSFAARALLAPTYRRLDQVAAIDAADASRFGDLGVSEGRRTVTGDARFDQVWKRARAADLTSPLLAPLAGTTRPTLVAGSTWPADEERLLPSMAAIARNGTPLRVILVPHEPTPAHLSESEARLDAAGFPHHRLGQEPEANEGSFEVVLVDRTGVLGDLYALADIAYVGGGFGTAGLHSVLEPAAFGAPVLFGPRHQNARDAAGLIYDGGGFEVANAGALENALRDLLAGGERRLAASRAARNYVEAGLGAAELGAEIIESLLGRR